MQKASVLVAMSALAGCGRVGFSPLDAHLDSRHGDSAPDITTVDRTDAEDLDVPVDSVLDRGLDGLLEAAADSDGDPALDGVTAPDVLTDALDATSDVTDAAPEAAVRAHCPAPASSTRVLVGTSPPSTLPPIVAASYRFGDGDVLVVNRCRAFGCTAATTARVFDRDFPIGLDTLARVAPDGAARWRLRNQLVWAEASPALGDDIITSVEATFPRQGGSLERVAAADGRVVWSTADPESGSWTRTPPHVVVGAAHIYTAHDFGMPTVFGGTTYTPSSSSRDVALSAYRFDGTHAWTRTWPTASTFAPTADGLGTVDGGPALFVMMNATTFDFGTGFVSRGGDGFMLRVDPTGALVGASSAAGRMMLRLGDGGSVLRTGNTIIVLSPAGDPRWNYALGSGARYPTQCIETSRGLVCAVQLYDDVDITANGATLDGPDLFVVSFDLASGEIRWVAPMLVEGVMLGATRVSLLGLDDCGRVIADVTSDTPFAPAGTRLDLGTRATARITLYP